MTNVKTETLDLFKQYEQETDTEKKIKIRNQIVLLNMKFVYLCVNRVKSLIEIAQLPYEDAVNIGVLGLIKSIQKYNLSKGYAFTSFACKYIEGEIRHYCRDNNSLIKIPRGVYRSMKSYNKLKAEGLSDTEIKNKLGLSDSDLVYLENANYYITSPDDTLPKVTEDSTYNNKSEDRQAELVLELIYELTEKESNVILSYYYKDNLIKSIAKYTGVTTASVQRTKKRGIAKLKEKVRGLGYI